jgi:tetratricopeptide (TPR) repeat protein
MKHTIVLWLMIILSGSAVAQTDQEKLDAFNAKMKAIQQQSDSLLKVLQKVKERSSAATPPPVAIAKKEKPSLNSYDKAILASPDTQKIRLIPKGTLSVPELDKYLIDLYKLMRTRFPPGSVKLADDIANAAGHTPEQLESAATLAWLNGYNSEAALLIMQGATAEGRDGLVLTNAGAILDLTGFGYKAVPILRTLVAVNPENGIALNNLGQAYCGLGLYDSAMVYLKGCIKLSPEHPEANNSAGFIEYKRGNKGVAKNYFETSIRGAFTSKAYQGLRSINKNDPESSKITKLIKPKLTYPEYFNQYKFKLPKQCENIAEADKIEEELKSFIKGVRAQRSRYERVASAMGKKVADSVMAVNVMLMQRAQEGKAVMRPFQLMATIMRQEAMEEHYSQKPTELSRFNEDNRRQLKELRAQYEKEIDGVSSDCKTSNEIKNKYLPQFAALNLDWQIKNLNAERKFLEDMLFWQPMASSTKAEADYGFYAYVKEYLKAVEEIAYQNVILKSCLENISTDPVAETPLELPEFECPYAIDGSILGADFSLNCQKVAFSLHFAVANFKMERMIKTRQSTFSVGIGDNIFKRGFEKNGVKGSASLDASMSLYLTVDPSGFNDAGMEVNASATASLEFEKAKRLKPINEKGKVSIGGSYRIGINSGLDMRDSEGRDLLAPPEEKILNKNVKGYSPK